MITLLGTLGVVSGRLLWRMPPVLYAGVALLIAGLLWNFWLRRPRRAPLVRLRLDGPA